MENEKASAGPSAFGSLLRRYRLAAGLSQEALAERARISVQGIGALERGDRRTPQRETLTLLTAALALTADERRGFEAAAVRQGAARSTRAAVSAGPWPSAPCWSLPLSLTSTVGRESEVGEIAQLVREHRLVTLTGAGGIGKTRTALDVGALFSDDGGGGVLLVELASLDATLVAETIAVALGIQEVPNRPLLETLLAYLRSTKLLLVLDNCEHVVAESALVVDRLLRTCPMLRILATSREPLGITGEALWRVVPLALPSATLLSADGDPGEIESSPAVRLLRTCETHADSVAIGARAAVALELRVLPVDVEVKGAADSGAQKTVARCEAAARCCRLRRRHGRFSSLSEPRHGTQ